MISGHCECKQVRYQVDGDISDFSHCHCSECGSNVLVILEQEPESLYLSMSAIEGNPPRPPGYHIFVGSKAVWYEISDDLAQYDGDAPE